MSVTVTDATIGLRIHSGWGALIAVNEDVSGMQVSHPLLHAAEGVFFRTAVFTACERLLLRVSGIRERDLVAHSWSVFGEAAPQLQRRIAGFRSSLGSP